MLKFHWGTLLVTKLLRCQCWGCRKGIRQPQQVLQATQVHRRHSTLPVILGLSTMKFLHQGRVFSSLAHQVVNAPHNAWRVNVIDKEAQSLKVFQRTKVTWEHCRSLSCSQSKAYHSLVMPLSTISWIWSLSAHMDGIWWLRPEGTLPTPSKQLGEWSILSALHLKLVIGKGWHFL